MADQKRPTVTVTNGLAQALKMHLYKPLDFGKGPVEARLIDEPVTLQPGSNPGIDKAFFEAWKTQNPNLSVMPLITAIDEPESGQPQGAEGAATGGEKSMDHDAQGRHVQNLLKFRERAEKVLDWAEARMKAEGAAPEPGREPVAAIGAVTAEDLERLRAELAEMGEHVTIIQQGHDAVLKLFEDVTEMRNWFAENKAGLETVLAMGDAQPGDEVDQGKLDAGASTTGPDLSGATSTSTTGPDLTGAGGSMISGADQGTALSPAAGGPGGPDVANLADAAARGAAGASIDEVGSEAQGADRAAPEAALTADEVIKDPTADPLKVGE